MEKTIQEVEDYLIKKLEEQERELVQDIEIKVINPCDYDDVHKAWKLFTSYLKQDENISSNSKNT